MFLFRQIKNNIHMSVSTKDVITSINLNVTVSSRLNLHIIFWSIIIRGFNVLFMLGQLIWFHLTSISPWHQKVIWDQAMVLSSSGLLHKTKKISLMPEPDVKPKTRWVVPFSTCLKIELKFSDISKKWHNFLFVANLKLFHAFEKRLNVPSF